jgi:hypothetical protein
MPDRNPTYSVKRQIFFKNTNSSTSSPSPVLYATDSLKGAPVLYAFRC